MPKEERVPPTVLRLALDPLVTHIPKRVTKFVIQEYEQLQGKKNHQVQVRFM